ncbi:MAG: HPr(Ser) kinase/phosphatase, partial [Clostridia bacterium]
MDNNIFDNDENRAEDARCEQVTLKQFCDECDLQLLLGKEEDTIVLKSVLVNRPGLLLAGFENYFGNNRVQIIGYAEHYYFETLSEFKKRSALERLFSRHIPCVIYSRGIEPNAIALEFAQKYKVPIMSSDMITTTLNGEIANYLDKLLAPSCIYHGTLLNINGTGVLLTGDSGMGKSETALELIHRGHRLVADDAVIIKRYKNELVGEAPENIKFLMEVRGIGIIDVRSMFGVGSVLNNEDINLIIHLEKLTEDSVVERLGSDIQSEEILGMSLPKMTIPVM